jgi:hypothetical protein
LGGLNLGVYSVSTFANAGLIPERVLPEETCGILGPVIYTTSTANREKLQCKSLEHSTPYFDHTAIMVFLIH